MKQNKFIIVTLGILSILAIVLYFKNSKSTLGSSQSDFAIIDTSTVTKIFMADKNNNIILLEKMEFGDWSVNQDYLASQSMINTLLATMGNISVREPVSKIAHDNVIGRMAALGIKVEIYQQKYFIDFLGIKLFKRERLSKSYYVGDSTKDNMGTFMRMDKSPKAYVVYIPGFSGFLHSRYSTKIEDWRDHTVFKLRLSDIKSVKLEFIEFPEESFIINNEDNRLITLNSLASGQKLDSYDTIRVLDYLTSFKDIRYEALLNSMNSEKKDSITNSRPLHIMTVTAINGNIYKMKTFHKEPNKEIEDMLGFTILHDQDRLYALINEEKDFVLVQYYVMDKILRNMSYLLGLTDITPNSEMVEIK